MKPTQLENSFPLSLTSHVPQTPQLLPHLTLLLSLKLILQLLPIRSSPFLLYSLFCINKNSEGQICQG